MVLSDRFAGKSKPNIARRTVIYVVVFALGALAIPALLSLIAVKVAARRTADPASGEAPSGSASADLENIIGLPKKPKKTRPRKGSKTRPRRANQPTPSGEEI